MYRRDFIKQGALATAGLTLLPTGSLFETSSGKVRLGYIGVGLRGRSHIGHLRFGWGFVAGLDSVWSNSACIFRLWLGPHLD